MKYLKKVLVEIEISNQEKNNFDSIDDLRQNKINSYREMYKTVDFKKCFPILKSKINNQKEIIDLNAQKIEVL